MIGLSNPLGLLALAAVAVLIALHLLTRRRQVVPVASLLIWRRIAAQPLERSRFRPDLLFWLRLGIVLALVGVLVRPWFASRGDADIEPLVVVLDVSASMQTREPGGARLDLARAALATRVDALAAGTPVMLLAAADRTRVVVPWTTEHGLVRRALDDLEALDTPTRLAPAIALALGEAASRPHARVMVATDLPPTTDELHWMQVGASDDNVAIAGVTTTRAPFGGVRDASALVRNHAARPHTVQVTATLDGRPWAVQRVELPAHGSATVRFGPPPGAGVLGVSLRDAAGRDALAVDDRAFALVPPSTPPAVSVVGDAPGLASLLTAALGAPPRVLARDDLDDARPAGVLVVAGALPPVLPPHRGLLVVDPPAHDPLCAGGAVVRGAAAVDWSAGHALLAGLGGLEALEIATARPLAVPAWGEAVVQATAGTEAFPLLVAGTRAGVRTACLGVGLDDALAASDRMPLAVLVLATVRWLGDGDAGGIALVTGRAETTAVAVGARPAARAENGAPLERVDPAVPALVVAPSALLATRVGVHRLETDGGAERAVANLFDDDESDVGRSGARAWTPAARSSSAPVRGRSIGWWCVLAALALALVEWLAWAQRGERS